MNRALLATLLLLTLLLAACGDTGTTAQPTAVSQATSTVAGPSQPVDSPTMAAEPEPTRLRAEPTATAAAPTATMAPLSASLSDQLIIDAFKAAGLPMGPVIIYTAETDPNKLLGRPNGYIAKANWHDTRVAATPEVPTEEIDISTGGGIEIYPDEAGAKARKDYIDGLGQAMPMLVEYTYVRGPILLRVSKELTPAQAEEYKAALDTIPLP